MEGYLRRFCNYQQSNWAQLLPLCELSINNRDSAPIGMSSFFLTHGYHVDPIDFPKQTTMNGPALSPAARAEQIVSKLAHARAHAEASMAYEQQRMQDNANRTRAPAPAYRVGDMVWLDLEHLPADRPSKKLDIKYARYQVVEVVNGDSYRLNTPPWCPQCFPCG